MMSAMSVAVRTYRASAPARWLPRALAGSLLAAATLVALSVDPAGVSDYSRPFGIALVVLAAVAALWVVRRGAEVRVRVTPASKDIEFRLASSSARLAYADVDRVDYAPAFGPSRSWLPAMTLVDRDGEIWRVPALLDDGPSLVADIVARAARSDLEAWAEARGLASRMRGSRRRLAAGYGFAGMLVGLAAAYALG